MAPGSGLESIEQLEPEEPGVLQPFRRTYALTPLSVTPPEFAVEQNNTEAQAKLNQITIDNPTDDEPIVVETTWQSWATLALGFISITLAGIGLAKGIRQFSNRRLIRKFA
jgi:hypothetical protein